MADYYIYRARTKDNQLITGKVQAASLEAARKILQENKLLPLSITAPKTFNDYIPFLNQVSLKEKTLFARQLSTMLEAGLTLAQALRLLIKQNKKGIFQNVLSGIYNDVQDGFSFSTALAKYPNVFDAIFINVVRSGEATGKLDIVLLQLSTNLEKEVSIKNKIRSALFYPIFILLVMVVVALIMTTQVIPQLKDVFLDSGQDLPGSTQLLLLISDTVLRYWYLMIIGVIAVIVGLRAYLRSDSGIEFKSRVALKLPIAGTIIEQSSMARFGRLLAILLGSGVPLLEALRLINDAFTNRMYKRAIAEVAAQVERGVPMSVPIGQNPVFPGMVGQMVAVGEQTGKMDEVMVKVAEYYESEVDSKVSGISSLIEPVIIVILGLGVWWLIQAILVPIYEISTSVS
jgi:type IV pilus assembly protein PilC